MREGEGTGAGLGVPPVGGGAGAAASDGDNGCESEARARRQRPLRGSHVHGAARSTAGGDSTKALLFLNACDKHVSRWPGGGGHMQMQPG